MCGGNSMIRWTKNPPINVGKVKHYRNLQNVIREEVAKFWTPNIVCKCSGDCVPIIVFFNDMYRKSFSDINGEFEFGTCYGIRFIVTPELDNQLDIYVDDKLLETIKII